MNLAAARVVLRPRTQGEILDLAALWCFAANRSLYAKLAAIVLVPSLAACLAARWLADWSWPAVWLLALALTTVAHGAFTIATGRALFEHEASVGTIVKAYARRLPSYVVALLVSRGLLAVVGITIVLWPAVWVRVAFVHEACLLEGSGPIAATKRAWRLARMRGLEIGILLGGTVLAIGFAILAVELLGQGLTDFVLQIGEPFGTLIDGGSPWALLGFHAAIPYVAVARFLGYVDERTRGDGWDIQLRFMALARRAA